MPTVLDATVVNSAYQTSASARPQMLSNGWIVAGVVNPSTSIVFEVSKDNGTTWTQLCFANFSYANGQLALTSVGTKVYAIYTHPTYPLMQFLTFDAITQTNVAITPTSIDTSQSGFSGLSIIPNSLGTELHATWASKNSTYANSFNIRYAKGTIATDGSVAWGAVEQRTKLNTTGEDAKNPSIAIKGNNPIIAFETVGIDGINADGTKTTASTNKTIFVTTYNGTSWSFVPLTPYGTYVQSSPSAIFVPQSVNGLANGRIHTFWHGSDATDTAQVNLRYSYSDDGGVTWSAMTKLTNGNVTSRAYPTATANKANDLFVLVSSNGNLSKIKLPNGGSWSALTTISSPSGHSYPSALFDLSVNFTEPLFIYKDTAKVGFYGTWTVTTISVTQGSIGQKTDKSNLLEYAITTDGIMSTITEKVNGVTIGTKTATSGESLIAGLTQAQWDAVVHGKYADATGGLNTLTITMGSEVFTYTFDKRLATDADVLSAVKAVQDADSVYLPSVKSKLVAKVGGSAGDSFETIINGIPVIKRKASGTVTSVAETFNATFLNTSTTNMGGSLTVTGLTFKPSYIYLVKSDGTSTTTITYSESSGENYPKTVKVVTGIPNTTNSGAITYHLKGDTSPTLVTDGSFKLPHGGAGTYAWTAYE